MSRWYAHALALGKHAPTLTEIAAFLEAAEEAGPRDHAFACLQALNGLTAESICAAAVTDLGVDTSGRRTLRATVLGAPVTLPLSPRTAGAIDAHLDGRSEGALLLGDEGLPLRPDEAARTVREVSRAAGLGHRLGRSRGL